MTLTIKCLTAAIALISAQAYAEDGKRHFDIPAQPLAGALQQLSAQSGAAMLYAEQSAAGKTSPALQGEYTLEEAVRKLLGGSGLTYSIGADGTVTLKSGSDGSDATMLGTVTVTGKTGYAENDPYNPAYNRSNASSGTRTDTPIMETPISIQVVPRAVIQDQQGVQVGDAIKNVSGVFQGFTFGGFAEEFMIRGFNTAYNNYLDGFRWPASRLTLANAERVEVVKGAAANLYGRIQPGGMINIVTKRPQATPYYALEQQFGSYDLYRTTADATGAINSDGSLMYRINFESLNKNSFRDFAFTDRVFLAPSLTWKVSDRTQFDLDFMYSDEDTLEDYGVVAFGNRPANIPTSRYLMEPSTDKSNTTLYNTALTLTHAFNDDWKVKARFNHLSRDVVDPQTYPWALDEDPSSATYGDLTRDYYGVDSNHSDTYFGTVNLTGQFETWGVEHKTLIGWEHYSGNTTLSYLYGSGNSINIFDPRYRPVNVANIPDRYFQDGRGSNSNGLYFQDQITLFDKLHILGGGRYDWVADVSSGFGEPSAAVAAANRRTNNSERFSPRVGLLYQPWQWLSLYGNYVESLGNANSGTDASGNVFAPEIAEQFEIGFKTAFFDNRLISSFAFYHLNKSNILVSVAGKPFSELVDGARSQGVEIDVSGQVTAGLNLIATYAYTDAIILQGKDFLGNVLDGNRLWNVPRNAGSLWAKYDMQDEALRGLSLGAGVYLQDQKEGDRLNDYQLPGWARVDAMLKYRLPIAKAKTTLQFNVENLLDRDYYSATLGDRFSVNVGQPRTFMGSVKVEF